MRKIVISTCAVLLLAGWASAHDEDTCKGRIPYSREHNDGRDAVFCYAGDFATGGGGKCPGDTCHPCRPSAAVNP